MEINVDENVGIVSKRIDEQVKVGSNTKKEALKEAEDLISRIISMVRHFQVESFGHNEAKVRFGTAESVSSALVTALNPSTRLHIRRGEGPIKDVGVRTGKSAASELLGDVSVA